MMILPYKIRKERLDGKQVDFTPTRYGFPLSLE
jgi:hypothetical protein